MISYSLGNLLLILVVVICCFIACVLKRKMKWENCEYFYIRNNWWMNPLSIKTLVCTKYYWQIHRQVNTSTNIENKSCFVLHTEEKENPLEMNNLRHPYLCFSCIGLIMNCLHFKTLTLIHSILLSCALFLYHTFHML